jgi:hypothetical protein
MRLTYRWPEPISGRQLRGHLYSAELDSLFALRCESCGPDWGYHVSQCRVGLDRTGIYHFASTGTISTGSGEIECISVVKLVIAYVSSFVRQCRNYVKSIFIYVRIFRVRRGPVKGTCTKSVDLSNAQRNPVETPKIITCTS